MNEVKMGINCYTKRVLVMFKFIHRGEKEHTTTIYLIFSALANVWHPWLFLLKDFKKLLWKRNIIPLSSELCLKSVMIP